jgi:hypothetical protein
MHRLSAIAALLALELAATAAPLQEGFRIDASAAGSLPMTWYAGGPALSHLGWGAALGAEYELASWVPARCDLTLFGDSESAISAGGELYRGWTGFRIAAFTGYRLPASEAFGSARMGFLAGAAVTAANYGGTNLAFAYPSILVQARADFLSSADSALWVGIPVEYMFRGGYTTVSAGLLVGWRMGPLGEGGKAEPK